MPHKKSARPGAVTSPSSPARLAFGSSEWSGAFGDLGTLVPFLLAYVTVVGVAPSGMLLGFGLALVATGLYFGTPQAVQPMKAIGAVSIAGAAQTATVTPEAVTVAALATGIIWLLLAATGTAERFAHWIGRPVIIGITLGLGIAFMLQGTQLMATSVWFAAPLLLVTVLLLSRKAILAMLLILVSGFFWALLTDVSMAGALAATRPGLALPSWSFATLSWEAFATGIFLLALPQVPLTLGNAILAPAEFGNREFPQRPVTTRQLAFSTGLMNTMGSLIGAVPMCHGAGGMAAQTGFGARSGGAPVILGLLLIMLALCFSESLAVLLRLFPQPALGVMLFLAGAQLALGSCDFARDKGERFVTLGTAALSIWNVGVAFLFGISMLYVARRGWLKL
jgi:MFS superfamily sulfate permease-like transporter